MGEGRGVSWGRSHPDPRRGGRGGEGCGVSWGRASWSIVETRFIFEIGPCVRTHIKQLFPLPTIPRSYNPCEHSRQSTIAEMFLRDHHADVCRFSDCRGSVLLGPTSPAALLPIPTPSHRLPTWGTGGSPGSTSVTPFHADPPGRASRAGPGLGSQCTEGIVGGRRVSLPPPRPVVLPVHVKAGAWPPGTSLLGWCHLPTLPYRLRPLMHELLSVPSSRIHRLLTLSWTHTSQAASAPSPPGTTSQKPGISVQSPGSLLALPVRTSATPVSS